MAFEITVDEFAIVLLRKQYRSAKAYVFRQLIERLLFVVCVCFPSITVFNSVDVSLSGHHLFLNHSNPSKNRWSVAAAIVFLTILLVSAATVAFASRFSTML